MCDCERHFDDDALCTCSCSHAHVPEDVAKTELDKGLEDIAFTTQVPPDSKPAAQAQAQLHLLASIATSLYEIRTRGMEALELLTHPQVTVQSPEQAAREEYESLRREVNQMKLDKERGIPQKVFEDMMNRQAQGGGKNLPTLDELREEGRRLASERDDLIAQGVDPQELKVPLAPGDLMCRCGHAVKVHGEYGCTGLYGAGESCDCWEPTT